MHRHRTDFPPFVRCSGAGGRSNAQLTTVISADYVLSGTWQQPAGDEYRFAVELMSTVDGSGMA